MKNNGFTLIEVLIGFAAFAALLSLSFSHARYVYAAFHRHTGECTALLQINNIQHVIARDVEQAEKIACTPDGSKMLLTIKGEYVAYFCEKPYLIRSKKNKTRLNTDDVVLNEVSFKRNGQCVSVSYDWKRGRKTFALEDSIMVWTAGK